MADPQPRKAGRPRKDEAGDTRAKLLDAALELFVDNGFAATSVRMIARGAGLSDGGLYAHFPTKQAVYDELLTSAGPEAVDELANRLREDAELSQDPRAFLTELVTRMLDFFDTPKARRFSLLLLREELPAHSDLVTGMVGRGASVLTPLFQSWAASGRLRTEAAQGLRGKSADTLAWELLAPLAFVRLVYLHGAKDARLEGRRRARSHLEFFLDAVLRD